MPSLPPTNPKATDALATSRECDCVSCLECGSVVDTLDCRRCPHCHARMHSRKPQSQYKTWMHLITAIILFFPANMLPISDTQFLGTPPQSDTILSSIILLWHHGSYVIAAIIFIASIATPLFKIAVLLFLLLHPYPKKPPVLQTRLYQFIHFVGRWSMIDVFVVALLGALIHGRLAQISPGVGIFAFAGVVVFTMFATETFDIRRLWDNYRKTCQPRN